MKVYILFTCSAFDGYEKYIKKIFLDFNEALAELNTLESKNLPNATYYIKEYEVIE